MLNWPIRGSVIPPCHHFELCDKMQGAEVQRGTNEVLNSDPT